MPYEKEISIKNKQFHDFLKRNNIEPENGIDNPVKFPPAIAYRKKIALHSDGSFLGYKAVDNKTVIDIAKCVIAVDQINTKISEIRASPSFQEHIKNNSRHTFRYSNIDGIFYWTENSSPPTNRLISEQTHFGTISAPLASFFQVNNQICNSLVNKVMQIIKELNADQVIDLYCGCGIFSLASAKSGAKFINAIDSDEKSIIAARKNAEALGINNIKFHSASIEKIMQSFVSQKIKPKENILIVDPPRTGLSNKVLKIISDAKFNAIIYISCAPDTLVRDLKILVQNDYKIISSGIFDMFPRTSHFETLTILKHKFYKSIKS